MNGDTAAALYFHIVFTYKELCKYHEINLSKTRLHAYNIDFADNVSIVKIKIIKHRQ